MIGMNKKVSLVGAIGATVATTMIAGLIVKSSIETANKRTEEEQKKNEKMKQRVTDLESKLSKTMGTEEERKELEKIKRQVEFEKSKLIEARKEILDGVEALKNAMYCADLATREDLVSKNYDRVTGVMKRLNKEVEYYKEFESYGKDFGWLEGNAAAVSKKLKETSADLESTLQLLGYEEKEKQLLRWYFMN